MNNSNSNNQIKTFSTTLENGLRIVGESLPAAESSTIGFLVNTGSRDETDQESGISHFLEHMLFKGTAEYNAVEFNQRLGELGAQANAYTSREHTFYFASVLPEYQYDYLKLLTGMLNPTLDPAEFAMEKKVILEEIALYQDDPQSFFYEQVMLDYHGTGTIGNSILGSTASVSALEASDLRDYINRRYAVDNLVFSIAGKFDWDQFVTWVQDFTKDFKPSNSPRNYVEHGFKKAEGVFLKEDLTLNHLMYVLPGTSAQSSDRYALSLYLSMLGDRRNSKLYWDLIQPGLVETLYCWADRNDQLGGTYLYAVCRPELEVEVAEKIKAGFQNNDFLTEKSLELFKIKAASSLAVSAELPYNRMIQQAEAMIYRGEASDIKKELAEINKVTLDDIVKISNQLKTANFGEYSLRAK